MTLARHFQISRSAGERNVKPFPGAPGRLAVDDREDRQSRWLAAMIVCFAFRSTLGADIAGAAARCRIANRNAQGARHHRFDRDFVSSGVLRRHRCSPFRLLLYFIAGLFFPALTAGGKALLAQL